MSKPASDQREHLRAASTAAVFIELQSRDPLSAEPASMLMCKLLNVSAAGMRIRVDRSLPAGNIFSLCASFNDGRKILRVVAEVRWVEKEDHYYHVGMSIFDSSFTDIASWKLLVADHF